MDALALASQIARRFKLLECEECALAIRDALIQAGVHGQIVEIRARGDYWFVTCGTYGPHEAISENGRHLGVRIEDVVIDNLHPDGAPFEAWLVDFDAPAGMAIHSQTPF